MSSIFELADVSYSDESDDSYEEHCDECGGKVVATGGHHYYNGRYNCYTLYLNCENCGPYEVECV